MKKLIISLICVTAASCFAGEIEDYYRLHGGRIRGNNRSFSEIVSTNHGITEIGIERTACYGKCPVYTFIVKSDGTFRYTGEMFVEHIGEFTGKIRVRDFHQLAQFIKDSDYTNLPDYYRAPVTDNATVYTLVVADGKKKTVSNYADSGPTSLWAIEQLIDNLLVNAKWDTPKSSSSQKH